MRFRAALPLVLCCGLAPAAFAADVDPKLETALAASPTANAIVVFRPGPESARTGRLSEVGRRSHELRLRRSYRSFPAAAVELGPRALAELRNDPSVRAVIRDGRVRMFLAEGKALIHANEAHGLGYRGTGQVIAVIDTGIDYKHEELGDAPFPNSKVIGGYDFSGDDADPKDEEGHGTAVAGILASSMGVAPDAKLVAIRVLNSDGEGEDSEILAGLDWMVEHRAQYGITLANLSLGGEAFEHSCDGDRPDYAEAMNAARDAGITVFAAAGNEAEENAIAEPACISSVISVGAVYDATLDEHEYCEAYDPLGVFCVSKLCTDGHPDADDVCCYSNSSDDLDLLAPSSDCRTLKKGGGWEDDFGGTSAASPYAAGVAALVLQAGGPRSASALLAALRATGRSVTDDRNDVVTPRVDAEAAVRSVMSTCTVPGAVSGLAASASSVRTGVSYSISWSALADVTEYEVEESHPGSSTDPIETRRTTSTHLAYSKTVPGTYRYRVHAYRSCGAGAYGGTVDVVVTADADPGSGNETAVVGALVRAGGVAGSHWQSELAIWNPGDSSVTAALSLLPTGNSSAAVARAELSVPAHGLRLVEDPAALFSSGDLLGALVVDSPAPLSVASRVTNDGGPKRYGQDLPAMRKSDALTVGKTGDLLLLRSGSTHRTNIGLVNLSPASADAVISLFAADGTRLAQLERTVRGYGHLQENDVFGPYTTGDSAGLRAEVTLRSGGERLFSYASVVDDGSGDPSTVMLQLRK